MINIRKDDVMDNKTTKYVIDFKNVESYFDMFEIISTALDFPDYFGNNWDAFWDCITAFLGRPTHIEILGLDVVERQFGIDTAQTMLQILKRFKHCDDDYYSHEIQIEIVSGDVRISLE